MAARVILAFAFDFSLAFGFPLALLCVSAVKAFALSV